MGLTGQQLDILERKIREFLDSQKVNSKKQTEINKKQFWTNVILVIVIIIQTIFLILTYLRNN